MNTGTKILIIDDSPLDRQILERVLSVKGLKPLCLENGEDAFNQIKSFEPNIVLLDILMPGLSGEEVLKSIRSDFSAVVLPVIMISAKTDASDVVHFLKLGANDYITKPINIEITLSRIQAHLTLSRLSKQIASFQESAAVAAMTATYNHEINNALSVALGMMPKFSQQRATDDDCKLLEGTLWRIANILKKITAASERHEIELESYAGSSKMVKIK